MIENAYSNLIWVEIKGEVSTVKHECLLISSLPGSPFRKRVESLPSDSPCSLKAKPGKLDIKDTNLVFYLSVYKFKFNLQTNDYGVISIFMSIQRH